MAKRRKLTEGKKNIIAGLIQEYNIQTANDIQEALKDLLGGTIQEMFQAELDDHLGYDSYERSENTDYRNGTNPKKLHSSYGEIPIDVPQDRDGDFEPQIVPKRKKDISEIEQKIISLYAKGLSTRQISSVIDDIYGFEVSDDMVKEIINGHRTRIMFWLFASRTHLLNSQRIVFPTTTALLKALYLATWEATKRWTMTLRGWAGRYAKRNCSPMHPKGKVYGELSIMYEVRLPE